MSLPDGNNWGNRATQPGAADDFASRRLPPRIALGGGVPNRRAPAQAVGRDVREAREIKIRRTAQAAATAAGPTLHSYALEWVDHYAGRGANDVINDRTRREYRRLLISYALAYFEPGERLRDVDEHRARAFVDWLCRLTGADGRRLSDRSVRNAVLPLQSCLRHAGRAALLGDGSDLVALLPRRWRGRAYEFDERRFLTRRQLTRLLAEIPDDWRALFDLLASTGLRISEAIALRVMDVDLAAGDPKDPRSPRDRRRPAHRSEVPLRPTHHPDQSRTRHEA